MEKSREKILHWSSSTAFQELDGWAPVGGEAHVLRALDGRPDNVEALHTLQIQYGLSLSPYTGELDG